MGRVEDRSLLRESWCSSREATRTGERETEIKRDRETNRHIETDTQRDIVEIGFAGFGTWRFRGDQEDSKMTLMLEHSMRI